MSRFEKLGEDPIWQGAVVSVARGRFRGPGGEVFDREVVHHPGAVSVVPVTDDGASVVLVRQYRAAIDRHLLEIPAGKRDVADEDPEITARRELTEEIGMRAGRMEKLAEFYNTPGFCDEYAYVFLARDMEAAPLDAQGLEEHHMTIETIALCDVPTLIARRELVDAKTIIGLCLAREHLAHEVESLGR